MMSRLYLFPLCSVTRTVWSSVRLETHVDKVLPANVAKDVWLCAAEAGYRECAYANDCHWACGSACRIQSVSRAIEPSSAVPYRRASQGMSFAPTSPQVHEMQSGLASFAFAIARPAGYQGDAFQASSPKNFQGRFWRPLFLSACGRHSVCDAPSYRTFAYSDRLSPSMLMGVGVIQSAPRIGYGP
jgi:hypothetical protein